MTAFARRRTDSPTPIADAADRRATRWTLLGLAAFWIAVVLLVLFFPSWARAADVKIPERCRQYQRLLTAEARSTFGVHVPVAVLAAQIHQESGCRSDARSAVGALGLTQFMPATAADMGRNYPDALGRVDPLSAPWSIGAQVRYMRDLMRARVRRDGYSLDECTAWWFGLKDYNGGSGWTDWQRGAAGAFRDDPVAVETFRACRPRDGACRSAAAQKENAHYPRRILITIQPAYAASGWGRAVRCTSEIRV